MCLWLGWQGHTARVLHMAQSPDGSTVVSAAADETLRFWKCFGDAPVAQKVRPGPHGLFSRHRYGLMVHHPRR